MANKQLTPHFTLDELCASQTATRRGIDNTPKGEHLANMQYTAEMMDKVRDILGGAAIHINSGYRSPALNAAVGGSSTSAHCKGQAVDFTAPSFGSPKAVCKAIIASGIEFDQLIYEGTWVHIAFDTTPRKNVLTAHFSGGTATYTAGIA